MFAGGRPASPALEPNAVRLGCYQQVPGRPPARELLAELIDARMETSARLRRALVSAGRVRPPPTPRGTSRTVVLATPVVSRFPEQLDSPHLCGGFEGEEDLPESLEEVDSLTAEFIQRAEHNLRANQWISETAPKRAKAIYDETHPLRLHHNRKTEERRLLQIVLRKKDGLDFQAFVNARHPFSAYDIATGRNHGPRRDEHVMIEDNDSNHSSGSASPKHDKELMIGLKVAFQATKHSAPVGTRKHVRDSIICHRIAIERKRAERELAGFCVPQDLEDYHFSIARPSFSPALKVVLGQKFAESHVEHARSPKE